MTPFSKTTLTGISLYSPAERTHAKRTAFWDLRRSAQQYARTILIAIFILLSAAPRSAIASLVITLYHNGALYIGSDSAVTSLETGKRMGSIKKTFRMAKNCCVAITGSATYDIDTVSGKPFASLDFSKLLERLSASQLTNAASLDRKMDFIAAGLNEVYRSLCTNGWGKMSANDNHPSTWLHFAGYSTRKGCFFIDGCLLEGTNDVHIDAVKMYRGAFDPNPICLQGEPAFLQALLSGEKPELLPLVSPGFTETATAITSDQSISDARITGFILEMFRLHKRYSAQFGYDKGLIGPPYRVFKITKDNVVELSPPAQLESTGLPEPLVQPDPSDEREIDEVMAKLKSSFKANDYTYVFDVMYAPIVEKMGGKAQGVLAAKAIIAQMKQQQIVMVSWKARKPYQYIQGESRTYAVIPYESVMTIAGKRLRQESYQLGIKAAGSHWQFVNGDNLNPEVFKEFFPDFPKSTKLPKLERVPE